MHRKFVAKTLLTATFSHAIDSQTSIQMTSQDEFEDSIATNFGESSQIGNEHFE